ncbi:GNAT family N-acetyltransferase [Thaumasiovibrio subtropicus]|uniref:GNAT family N-acetyltransferase n=1 Tax=Thaumasiovibrio subtropicus TaxID=1891207 RepID=UPI000B354A5C|nr:GNAT family N-acetyltransferase [Thaumasiovibrio subtropicus]
MTIAKVTVNEIEATASLFDAYRVFYGHASDIAAAREFINARVVNKESVILLARDEGGKAVGFTQLYPSFSSVSVARTWILNDLFVNETQRGKGIGKQLLNAAKAHAIATGAKGLSLETARDNTNAQALYESLGYERDNHYYSYFLTV